MYIIYVTCRREACHKSRIEFSAYYALITVVPMATPPLLGMEGF